MRDQYRIGRSAFVSVVVVPTFVSVTVATERATASQGFEKSVGVFIEHRNSWDPLYGAFRSRIHGFSKTNGPL